MEGLTVGGDERFSRDCVFSRQCTREIASCMSQLNPYSFLIMPLNFEALERAATEARGLAMDAVEASQSGHLGLPLGCAEMGAVLYGHVLKHNPDNPRWLGRDYFVLSAGHGSMLLYAWLHISGYDLPMEEI